MDHRLEMIVVPVSDVDDAKRFYADLLGWHVDVDSRVSDAMRVVQLTPPGSPCSVTIGVGLTDALPGTYKGMHLVVSDIVEARRELLERGVEVGEVRHMGAEGWVPGPHPDRGDFQSFAELVDPDGNGWVLQERDHGRARA